MDAAYLSEQLQTPVTRACDVFVLGGGVAGIAAALAAARQGKKVLLCEKSYILGGLATSGLVAIYLPLCDGNGNQISFGIAEELLKLSVKDWHNEKRGYLNWLAPNAPREKDGPRYAVDFNPQFFALAAEELLRREGVEILYGSAVVACKREGNRITHIILENATGRQGVSAKSFVDASGDGVLVALSQTPGVTFTQGNILAAWYFYLEESEYKLTLLGYSEKAEEEQAAEEAPLPIDRRFTGLSGEELSEMVELSHRFMYRDMQKRKAADDRVIPVTMPTIPQIRMTRRIDGAYTLQQSDEFRHFDRSVGMVSDWKKRGPYYEIPLEMLYNRETVNLICAGRCVSNDEYMWERMRVIPCCAVTGEAAGTAAAMSDDFTALDIRKLQEKLTQNGVILHRE